MGNLQAKQMYGKEYSELSNAEKEAVALAAHAGGGDNGAVRKRLAEKVQEGAQQAGASGVSVQDGRITYQSAPQSRAMDVENARAAALAKARINAYNEAQMARPSGLLMDPSMMMPQLGTLQSPAELNQMGLLGEAFGIPTGSADMPAGVAAEVYGLDGGLRERVLTPQQAQPTAQATIAPDLYEKATQLDDVVDSVAAEDPSLGDMIRSGLNQFKEDVSGLMSGLGDAGKEIFETGGPLKQFIGEAMWGMNDEAQALFNAKYGSLDEYRDKFGSKAAMDAVAMVRNQVDTGTIGILRDAQGRPVLDEQGRTQDIGTALGLPPLRDEPTVSPTATTPEVPWYEQGQRPQTSATQPVWTPELPDYLQQEYQATPDYTGTFRGGLVRGHRLPSEQITGLLAPATTGSPYMNSLLGILK